VPQWPKNDLLDARRGPGRPLWSRNPGPAGPATV